MATELIQTDLGIKGGMGLHLSVDGKPEYILGGITIDWTTVAAVSGADVLLKDGNLIKIGQKYLRYGQVMARITATGKWGPYDPAAADGRQTAPAAGVPLCVLDVTHTESVYGGPTTRATVFASGIVGGYIWRDRLIAHATTANLANGPTLATLLAALPRLALYVS